MRHRNTQILTIIFLVLLATHTYAKDKAVDKIAGRIAQGKEFIIAIPPNESFPGAISQIALEIYIASQKATTVTLTLPNGKKMTKNVDSMKIQSFSSTKNEIDFSLETYTSETVLKNAIFISSPDSISVYVLNAKSYTADGFLALPVHSWGKEYIHLGYYDFFETQSLSMPRGGGFIIIASKDSTHCKIMLNGRGATVGKTMKNRKIGDSINIVLNKGQIYMVLGDSKTRGIFDLSGTDVTSDQPIGFISFHERTLIPSFGVENGRDALNEMLPPINSWGKKYTTVEFKRGGKGDFFRLISSFDDTHWKVKSYDMKTGKLLLEQSGTLNKKGDFFEYNETALGKAQTESSIKGVSVWEADKPILVMQYAYSSGWDGQSTFDPFMTLTIPEEQFVNTTVFQVPDGNAKFKNNWLNIIAIGSKVDTSQKKLKSIKIDNTYLWQSNPDFITNKVPGTNLYWATVSLAPGAHKVTGDAKFGAYVYGFDEMNSYGWPAAMSIDEINTVDSLPPVVSIKDNCKSFDVSVTDIRFGGLKDLPRQEDKGLYSVELLAGSYNVEMLPSTILSLGDTLTPEAKFQINVIRKDQPGLAKFVATDNEGNETLDSIYYSPDLKPYLNVSIENASELTSVSPGKSLNLKIGLNSNHWEQVSLDSLSFELVYPNGALYPDSSGITFPLNPNSQRMIAISTVPMGIDTIHISLKGNFNISSDANIVLIPMTVLLYPHKDYDVAVQNIHTIPGIDCIETQGDSIIASQSVCAFDLRQIKYSPASPAIINIAPNPTADGFVDISYIASEDIGKLEIYDISGKNLKTRILPSQKAGLYKVKLDVADLPKGIYSLIFRSGTFVSSSKLAIVE